MYILFMCPHNAAKSVLALAYFRDRAARLGLAVQAGSAGTDPDPEFSPAVVELLESEGLTVPCGGPRHVDGLDLAGVSRIVSMGCDLSGLATRAETESWDDVPPPSQDLGASRDAIRSHVEALVEALRSPG